MDVYGSADEFPYVVSEDVIGGRTSQEPEVDLSLKAWRFSPSVDDVTLATDLVALTTSAIIAMASASGGRGSTWLPIAYVLLVSMTLHLIGPRRGRIEATVVYDIGWVLQRMALPLLILVPVAGSSDDELGVVVPIAVAGVFAGRVAGCTLLRRARIRGAVWEPCLIVGTGDVGRGLAGVLRTHPEYGWRPVGFVGDVGVDAPLPLLGGCDELASIAHGLEVRTVLIADPDLVDEEIVRALSADTEGSLDAFVVPRLAGLGSVASTQRLWGLPLVHIERSFFRPSSRRVKRVSDLAIASTALVLLSPVLAAAAIATRLSSPGPILFRQTRVSMHGRRFEMLKFRTMTVSEGPDIAWSATDDERLTKSGRLLRRASIDELPQLFNVLRGEMSLVGPRPERPHFVGRFSEAVPGYADRHRMPGGITGLAQTRGRSREMGAIPLRARYDNEYIESWSWWNDIVIMLRTFRHVFRGDREPDASTRDTTPVREPGAGTEASGAVPTLIPLEGSAGEA